MTAIDPKLLEQLSAWMDGELPADEARFLQRRLGNDPALREQWERWQIASACLQGQRVRRMDADLPARIAAGIADAANDPAARRPRLAWLATAAAVVVAVALLPRMLAVDPGRAGVPVPPPAVASAPAQSPLPATLDAVANPAPAMSPLPSVRDFPLVDTGSKGWPRSPLLADPRGRDGLLVRGVRPLPPVDDAPPPADDVRREAGGQ
jgi:hypothetical protein